MSLAVLATVQRSEGETCMRAVVWIVVCSMVKLVRLLQCCGLAVDTTRGAKSFWKNSISRRPRCVLSPHVMNPPLPAPSPPAALRRYTVWPSLVTVLTHASTHSCHSGERFPNRRSYSTHRALLEVRRLSLFLLTSSFEWTWHPFPLISFTHTFDAVLFLPLKRRWLTFPS